MALWLSNLYRIFHENKLFAQGSDFSEDFVLPNQFSFHQTAPHSLIILLGGLISLWLYKENNKPRD
jgi:hypothetical protein